MHMGTLQKRMSVSITCSRLLIYYFIFCVQQNPKIEWTLRGKE